ncbi:ubiquitinyl hydrolase [Fomitiporia mediterranea MF3/22]|uniref:ubiquitinyl hydrolase n=1 Tax=Fomitiporia mediterranea (strain MF3/22) TaxID=694068 RepID=UPI000440771B|nr:ubiquitinyl hydrolase [Fomitiporia mediterranea MF3/22]EJD06187.1 ubiquitinyl hydrolase [Fomitiporia mediterranea MF3/22]
MAAACSHLARLSGLVSPKLSQSVHREECTQCFDSQDSGLGIDVCLSCFNGGCLDSGRHHARTHAEKTGHTFALNIKRRPKPISPQRVGNEEPPAKMTKLAIVEQREEDKFDHFTTLKCWSCESESGRELPQLAEEPKVKELVRDIMTSMSSARQSEVQAWEEEIVACEHTLMLEQAATGPIPESGLAHCQKCHLKENLWLCLICGSLGCGRQQYGGLGGNGHGLAHYQETRHPVSVKLGTITPEGSADIYCYECNDARLDLDLAAHLHTFGINVSTQTKTEKSMTELQIEHNLKFDFSLTDESGKALDPVFGPGLTGLKNLGNSCYMASVIQSLFSLPAFQTRYLPSAPSHWQTCSELLPATCLECQMHKLADGLLSGRYSKPQTKPSDNPFAHDSPAPIFQEGISPATFKALIGKGHVEFATMRQQDAEEFFTHLLTVLRQNAKKRGAKQEDEPTEAFRFGMEQRLQCSECMRVRYRVDSHDTLSVPVPAREKGKDTEGKAVYEDVQIAESLEALTADEALEYQCPGCNKKVLAMRRSRFSTFPKVLAVHAKKFQIVNWVPAKLDIPLILPADDELLLDSYLSQGLQRGETELPEESTGTAAIRPSFNEAALAQLEGMGFPQIRCKKALLATGNGDAEAAMEWLFAHMEDPDIDDPLPTAGGAAPSVPEPSSEQIGMLVDMGFTPGQASKALRETGGNSERAVDWLFSHPDDMGEDLSAPAPTTSEPKHPGGSATLPARYRLKAFISHKGPSVHSGHYVAHIKTEKEGWVLFNDEKVVRADDESVRELKKLAYLYVFEQV